MNCVKNITFFHFSRIDLINLLVKTVQIQDLHICRSCKFTCYFSPSLQCRHFLQARKCFCSRKCHVETEERRKWGESKGVLFLLSPIFHCHKIKDGSYNNTNTNKVLPNQNTPALQAIFPVKKKVHASVHL